MLHFGRNTRVTVRRDGLLGGSSDGWLQELLAGAGTSAPLLAFMPKEVLSARREPPELS